MIFSGLVLQNFAILSRNWSIRWIPALLSPLFLFKLFHAQASGGFANTVELAVAKYGPSFAEYMDNTPLIFPAIFGFKGI